MTTTNIVHTQVREKREERERERAHTSMGFFVSLLSLLLALAMGGSPTVCDNSELRVLMSIKAELDPQNRLLASWTPTGDPCGGSFEGLACNENGQVANISLQSKGLFGKVPASIAGLRHLTGLYLHYNSLNGEIPTDIASLPQLSDLYLNVNNLSGDIPPEIGNMTSLQVLQLCYNQLSGSIPTQLGSLKKLTVLALQSNQLTGAIPASLGDLEMLMMLDLSFNRLFGSIPTKLADIPQLEVLDVRNNTLSGNVPPALKRLNGGFQHTNNPSLCGVGFPSLKVCNNLDQQHQRRPEPYGPGPTRDIPETANLQLRCNQTRCSTPSRKHKGYILIGVIAVIVSLSSVGILAFAQYYRKKQRLRSSVNTADNSLTAYKSKEVYRKNGSPLISLEYSNGWDPLADSRNFSGLFSEEVLNNFRFSLEEVESATQYYSEANLLSKSNFAAIYKGVLRDGSSVAIKSISKSSCKSDEAEFLKGLKILSSLRHENLVKLRGFCCSKARGECFLVYEFVSNGSLLGFLDVKDSGGQVLEWSTRVSIINGIASGIGYLHRCQVNKPALVHQNISAEKVLLDHQFNPLLSDSGLHNLLTNDIVFSTLKASAAMGYLAPEYTTTGRFTEKSDVYAFGILVLQIILGKRKLINSVRLETESNRFADFIELDLHGKFVDYEAEKIVRIALLCTHESPDQRPTMEMVIEELGNCNNCLLNSDVVAH